MVLALMAAVGSQPASCLAALILCRGSVRVTAVVFRLVGVRAGPGPDRSTTRLGTNYGACAGTVVVAYD